MPEYLAPGVFVEETSFRSKSIEGLSTTTTGFIGPARYGPIDLANELVTSVVEFEQTYGNRRQLSFNDAGTLHNYLWHGVRAFFEEGGKRLYVSRVFRQRDGTDYTGFDDTVAVTDTAPLYPDGHARALLGGSGMGQNTLLVYARYPGDAGNAKVRFTLRVGQSVLSFDPQGQAKLGGIGDWDVVLIRRDGSPPTSPPGMGAFFLAQLDPATGAFTFTQGSGGTTRQQGDLEPGEEVRVLRLIVSWLPTDPLAPPSIPWDVALDSRHAWNGANDSLHETFRFHDENPEIGSELPLVIDRQLLGDGLSILQALLEAAPAYSPPYSPPAVPLDLALEDPTSSDAERSVEVLLAGGNDGDRPAASDYEGVEIPNSTRKTGLMQFEDLDDISIVAAPGSTFGYENGYQLQAQTIIGSVIDHCANMHYRIGVLDSGDGQTLSQVRALRATLDSSYAALYYPWVKVLDPLTQQPIFLPPSGFVAGIYARNDVNRAVYKAPANEVVNLALGFELSISKAQQEVLNPEGINAFRFFEDRGYRLWGARTVSSDPEWKYVNLRRYFAYLEHSIDKGTQWAVFEPNGDQLWASARRTVDEFLLNEWQKGALLGDKPEKAYFVKCDRSTMTQNDLDNGRLVMLIGVAPLRPAEFVIFRIGQWTGDSR
ncbi:MAG TPA: phage tail sheath subtilisin-like domain-containing protein [Anaeromyxobacter sp.]|nr:phage tail sheath subtilisin-like domain-containing protein [Anaeromyxobacter sp.]